MSQISSPVKSTSVEEGDINNIVIQDEDDDSWKTTSLVMN